MQSLPIKLKKYFWDTDFEKLDVKKNKVQIISRLLCFGDLEQIKWLEATYTKDDIKYVAIHSRDLIPIVANYLRQQFNLKKEKMAYYRNVELTNSEFKRVRY